MKLLAGYTDGSESADLMDKDDLVHDMESVSPRSHEDNLPVSQQRILKFELQLYKKDSHYLLDVQVSPPGLSHATPSAFLPAKL